MESFNRDQFFLEEWPNALRSGEYKQGTGTLLKEIPIIYRTQNGNLYCCLGVACDLLEKKGLITPEDWIDESNLPDKVREILEIDEDGSLADDTYRTSLVEINDSGDCSFRDIADIIVSIYKDDRFYPAYDYEDDNYD